MGISRRVPAWTTRLGPQAGDEGGGFLSIGTLRTNSRIKSLEVRLARLETGWTRHIPSLLDGMSVALGEARKAGRIHERVDAVRDDMDRLALRFDRNLAEINGWLSMAEPPHGDAQRGTARALFETLPAVLDDGVNVNLTGRTLLGRDRVNLSLKGISGSEMVVTSAFNLPFGSGSVRSITAATDLPFATSQQLELTLTVWLRLLKPGGVCMIERFYVADLLDDLALNHVDLAEARSIVAFLVPSDPAVSADEVAQALKVCGYQQIEVSRRKDRGVSICAVRPLDASVA